MLSVAFHMLFSCGFAFLASISVLTLLWSAMLVCCADLKLVCWSGFHGTECEKAHMQTWAVMQSHAALIGRYCIPCNTS